MTFKKTYFKAGDWNALCDICGEKHKASHLKLRWDGLRVCSPCWEIRHPQDLIRPIKERNSVPWTRPRPEDLEVEVCTISGVNAVANWAVAGCMIAGHNNGTPPEDQLVDDLYPPTFNPNTL